MSLKVIEVIEDSPAEEEGLKPGDRIVSVNGYPVNDQLDLMFYSADDDVSMTVQRGTYEFIASFSGDEDFGFELEPMGLHVCGNDCVFCFIDQNPSGMRKEIYVKDEDYRLSFLHGSYFTLTNISEADMVRIVRQRLSPLYVSVHATDVLTRLKLLGIRRDDGLLEKMDRLLTAGIELHCQIVVCPGINDGDILTETIHELRRRYPGVRSVAVVPVGLTAHRENLFTIVPVDEDHARKTIALVDGMHDGYARETGDGFVYCADEWYLRAGNDVPGVDYYDDFPQIENGVGMVRDFLDVVSGMDKRVRKNGVKSGRYVLVTGRSMSGLIGDFAERLSRIPGISARSVAVDNDFYGCTVTVSGLLTGGDILRALQGTVDGETVVLPPNCLNTDGLFLDDMHPGELALALGADVIQGEYDPLVVFLEETASVEFQES